MWPIIIYVCRYRPPQTESGRAVSGINRKKECIQRVYARLRVLSECHLSDLDMLDMAISEDV